MKGLTILFAILGAWAWVMHDDAKKLTPHQQEKPLPECRKPVHWKQDKGPPTVGYTCYVPQRKL